MHEKRTLEECKQLERLLVLCETPELVKPIKSMIDASVQSPKLLFDAMKSEKEAWGDIMNSTNIWEVAEMRGSVHHN